MCVFSCRCAYAGRAAMLSCRSNIVAFHLSQASPVKFSCHCIPVATAAVCRDVHATSEPWMRVNSAIQKLQYFGRNFRNKSRACQCLLLRNCVSSCCSDAVLLVLLLAPSYSCNLQSFDPDYQYEEVSRQNKIVNTMNRPSETNCEQ